MQTASAAAVWIASSQELLAMTIVNSGASTYTTAFAGRVTR
ncbi:hypothetical protein ABH995_006038 [Bradyrhizobium yuanmingense]